MTTKQEKLKTVYVIKMELLVLLAIDNVVHFVACWEKIHLLLN